MEHFADRLFAKMRQAGSVLCVGLDPRFEALPAGLQEAAVKKHGRTAQAAAEAVFEFNRRILEAIAGIVAVVKVQVAFYERYGVPGMAAYERTIRHARSLELVVIGDAKRGDIASTAEVYAEAHLGPEAGDEYPGGFGADAVTVSPYLGPDTLEPFIKRARETASGLFVLVKTSNPGAGAFQDAPLSEGGVLHQAVAGAVDALGAACVGPDSGYSLVGAVVGAPWPEQLAELRELMPRAPFLIPGYGAQGGRPEDVARGFDRHGSGAVVNSSRGIILAYQKPAYARFGEENFAQAAAQAAQDATQELNEALARRR